LLWGKCGQAVKWPWLSRCVLDTGRVDLLSCLVALAGPGGGDEPPAGDGSGKRWVASPLLKAVRFSGAQPAIRAWQARRPGSALYFIRSEGEERGVPHL